MPTRRPVLALLALAAAFAVGLHALFAERFESGDIYPAYSTLRTDPVGARALYSALDGPLEARRAFSALEYRDPDPGSAWFFLGQTATRHGMPPEQARIVDSLARNGARVAVAFGPEDPIGSFHRAWREAGRTDTARADSAGAAEDSAASVPPRPTPKALNALKARREGPSLGIRTRRDTSRAEGDSAGSGRRMAYARGADGDSLPWISALGFDSLDAAWTVLYRRDTLPVIVERSLGRGSLVLIADSYWASNEALFRATPGRLLASLIGDRKRVIFDEFHLGIGADDSLADLLARHGLHGMLPSLLLLLSAWLWRARGAFDPSPPVPAALPAGAEGAGNSRGMRGLLRRYVPSEGLLEACYGLWRETEGRASKRAQAVEAEAGRILADLAADARDSAAQVEGYRRIQNLLKEGTPR